MIDDFVNFVNERLFDDSSNVAPADDVVPLHASVIIAHREGLTL